jgi:YidC/Oxa1 family membrane protein insertase
MNIFDLLVVQPIFNVILAIYGVLPGHDFGLSIILFAVIVRYVMLPLIRKQLHQTKVMRQIQPELKKIKQKAAGDKAAEGRLMMELYRERGVNPLSSLGALAVQLPVFIALYQVIHIASLQKDRIGLFAYDFIEKLLSPVGDIVQHSASFQPHLFNIDLTAHALGNNYTIYWPLLILAVISAVLQYIQSKQLMPQAESGKKLSQLFKSSSTGGDVDQAEISAAISQQMILFFPIIAFLVALYLPGALVLFYVVSSGVAIYQQKIILGEDVDEMEEIASKKSEDPKGKTQKSSANQRAKSAKPAQTVYQKTKSKSKTRFKKRGG